MQDPNGKITKATYDGAGRVQTITDPVRNTTTYTLDPIGNVTQIVDPVNGPTKPTKFTYDDVNNHYNRCQQ